MLIFFETQRTRTTDDERINGYQSTKELTDDRGGRPETQAREERKENGRKEERRGRKLDGRRKRNPSGDERLVTACGRTVYSGRSLV